MCILQAGAGLQEIGPCPPSLPPGCSQGGVIDGWLPGSALACRARAAAGSALASAERHLYYTVKLCEKQGGAPSGAGAGAARAQGVGESVWWTLQIRTHLGNWRQCLRWRQRGVVQMFWNQNPSPQCVQHAFRAHSPSPSSSQGQQLRPGRGAPQPGVAPPRAAPPRGRMRHTAAMPAPFQLTRNAEQWTWAKETAQIHAGESMATVGSMLSMPPRRCQVREPPEACLALGHSSLLPGPGAARPCGHSVASFTEWHSITSLAEPLASEMHTVKKAPCHWRGAPRAAGPLGAPASSRKRQIKRTEGKGKKHGKGASKKRAICCIASTQILRRPMPQLQPICWQIRQ